MSLIIDIQKLNKGYVQPSGDKLEILKELDFKIELERFVSIIGHSGSGKSTLLHILGLLDVPDNYEKIDICGTSIGDLSLEERTEFRGRNIGFIFQFHQLLPEFTALQNVALPMRLLGSSSLKSKKRAMDLMSLVFSKQEMADKVYARKEAQLSGGQCQRVAIARALANDPTVIFADEPTGSLDSESAERVLGILSQLSGQGKTVIMITHQMELAGLADEVYGLIQGKLINKTDEVKRRVEGIQKSTTKRLCPVCQVPMTEILYQKKVLIDKCTKCHGIWLDNGELEMVSINVNGFCDAIEGIVQDMRSENPGMAG